MLSWAWGEFAPPARVGDDMARKKMFGNDEPASVAATENTPVVPVPDATSEAPEASAPAPVVLPPEQFYRVLETKKISYHGQTAKLRAGDVFAPTASGPDFLDVLKAFGVKLEKV